MPETTRSKAPPNTPRRANITQSAGGPVTAHASVMPGSSHAVHLRLDEVDGADGRTGPGVLTIGRRHDHVVVVGESLGQPVEADGVDTVVVGNEDPHPCVLVGCCTLRGAAAVRRGG